MKLLATSPVPPALRAALLVLAVAALGQAACSNHGEGGDCAGRKCDSLYPDGSPGLDAQPSGDAHGGPDAAALDPAVVAACEATCQAFDVCFPPDPELPPCMDNCLTQAEMGECDARDAAAIAACAEAGCDDIFTCFIDVPCFAVCGDEFCSVGEDCTSCPADCGETCPGTCPHDVCSEGSPLDPGCTECAAEVCAAEPSCCEIGWFSHTCFPLANDLCGAQCEIPPDE